MPTLRIVDPDGHTRSMIWPEGSIGLGRDPTNHVVIPDEKVERWHAAIFMDPGPSYRLRSLVGRAGLTFGRERRRCHVLQDGDEFRIGSHTLAFHAATQPDAAGGGRTPAVRLDGSATDLIGAHAETQELRAPDWTDAGWGLEHGPAPSAREILDLFQSVKAVASMLGLDEMLECLLEQVHRLAAPSVIFAALVRDDGSLDVRATRTASRDPGPEGPKVSQSTVRRCIELGLPILVTRANARGRSMHTLGIERALCLPLVADGRVRGIAYADWRAWGDRPVEESRLEWLAALAMYAGSAFENALHHDQLRAEHERLRSQHARLQQSQRTRTQIVGVSAATRQLVEVVDRCAARDIDVLILGPTGTGKELVARRIHEGSKRRDGPFVPVNCAAIPAELFESEMFGIEPRALPGVPAGRLGRFREADGGTLFMDEFAELSLDHQARLLRVLQDHSVTPVGGRPVAVDLRVIAATNRDIDKAVEQGVLRSDLYNRLGVPIRTTPLRERAEDIPILAYYMIDRMSESEREAWREIAPGVMKRLLEYGWPGNVRQLGRCLRDALVFAGERIELAHLQAHPELAGDAGALPSLEDAEADHIRRVLKATGGNQARAAKILEIVPNTLTAKMRLYRIRRDEFQ
jgi:hydrogenase-4 transcriptional activator